MPTFTHTIENHNLLYFSSFFFCFPRLLFCYLFSKFIEFLRICPVWWAIASLFTEHCCCFLLETTIRHLFVRWFSHLPLIKLVTIWLDNAKLITLGRSKSWKCHNKCWPKCTEQLDYNFFSTIFFEAALIFAFTIQLLNVKMMLVAFFSGNDCVCLRAYTNKCGDVI